ncbi:MAG: anti-sigma factor family protein [Actinomycetota bacterium]
MECGQAREHISAFDESEPPIAELGAHLAVCEDCRTEQAQYGELMSAMKQLADVNLQPPAWLLASLTEKTLERARRVATVKATGRQIGEHPKVAAGGAILLAGVAGAWVFGRRRLRRVRSPGLVAA